MKSIALSAVVVALIGSAACTEPSPTASLPVLELTSAGDVVANGGQNAVAHLAGHNEVPARDTRARGNAVLHLSDDGLELSFKLIVANIENVVQAHIHAGIPGMNGPVVAFLYGPFPPGGGLLNGVIAEGTITAANLIGPLAGGSMDDLVSLILSGGAYVNVHTNDGVGAINTGPGDFPGGEVRGPVQ